MILHVFNRAPKRITDDTESDTEDDDDAENVAVKPVVKKRPITINNSKPQKSLALAPPMSSLPSLPVEQPCFTGNHVHQSTPQSSFEHSSTSFSLDNQEPIDNSALHLPLLPSSLTEHPPLSNSSGLNMISFPSDNPAISSSFVSAPSSDPCSTDVSAPVDFATPTVLAGSRPTRDSTPRCPPAVQSLTNGRSSGGTVRPLLTPRSTCDAETPAAGNLTMLFKIDHLQRHCYVIL